MIVSGSTTTIKAANRTTIKEITIKEVTEDIRHHLPPLQMDIISAIKGGRAIIRDWIAAPV